MGVTKDNPHETWHQHQEGELQTAETSLCQEESPEVSVKVPVHNVPAFLSSLKLVLFFGPIINLIVACEGVHIHRRKPLLNDGHKLRRLQYVAWAMSNPDKWERQIFSDEKLVDASRHCRKFIWCTPGKEHRQYRAKGGNRISYMMWSSMSIREGDMRVGTLHHLIGRQNRWTYIKRLQKAFKEPIYAGIKNGTRIFQQDNCPYHVTDEVMEVIRNNSRRNVSWPPRSPDFSPIEFLWGEMERYMSDYKASVTSKAQLAALCKQAFAACSTVEHIRKYKRIAWCNMMKALKRGGGNDFRE